jgi:hypothetical protein
LMLVASEESRIEVESPRLRPKQGRIISTLEGSMYRGGGESNAGESLPHSSSTQCKCRTLAELTEVSSVQELAHRQSESGQKMTSGRGARTKQPDVERNELTKPSEVGD